MGLLDKVLKKKESDDESSPDTTVDFLSQDSLESPPADEEQAVESDAGDGMSALPEDMAAANLLDEYVGDGEEVGEADGDSELEPDSDDPSDDLMDIFTEEEEEDIDMSALASNLEEVNMADLLGMAVEVSDELREFVKEFADAEALDAA